MTETTVRPPLKPRRTARDRLVRRARIMERVREGRSYEEIAEAEGLSRERIRQIVVEALKNHEADAQRDHARLQLLRLAPALRLAAQGVAEGDRQAIGVLIRVLDRLDKYQAAGVAEQVHDENTREKLLNKLDAMARRMRDGRREESDDSADEADEAAGASEPRQAGGGRAGGGRERGKIRFRPAVGPKALILLVCAKEKTWKSLEFPWKKLGNPWKSLEILGESWKDLEPSAKWGAAGEGA